MMTKPSNWDTTPAQTGEYTPLPAGGYECRIVAVQLGSARSGAPMMTIAFDIESGAYAGYYKKQYEGRKASNPEVKWGGLYYQLTDGDALGRFKGMIQNIEESNPGYTWNWDDQSLVGKLFGGKFREEEYIGNDGKVHTSTKCISIRPIEGIEAITPPEKKCIEGARSGAPIYNDEEILF
ncbi:hypothetical protein TAMA11512_08960 [Selenomonas sp. TAMA-11512]|uniref:hypothetical protein n=1 Tax=Selenomonas sp. TAMA-11512 TaxID=3095337 RepID=UPI00308E76CC|nr:hypothetical protein TAMA11512_08960 [Selenomonas sp. TAMA-11512]